MLTRNGRHVAIAAFAVSALAAITLAPRASLAGGSGELRIRSNLINAGVDTNAKGRTDFRERSGVQDFKVQVQGLDAGTYDLLVAGMMQAAVVTSTKTSGHCRTNQAHLNGIPQPVVRPSVSASVGPTRTSEIAMRMNKATPSVSPMATSRTFHHGRPSSIS